MTAGNQYADIQMKKQEKEQALKDKQMGIKKPKPFMLQDDDWHVYANLHGYKYMAMRHIDKEIEECWSVGWLQLKKKLEKKIEYENNKIIKKFLESLI